MRSHIVLALVAVIAMLGVLTSSSVEAQTKVVIGTGVDPAFSQIFVAQEAGIFKRNGLDVDIRTGASGSAMIPLLIGNDVQVAYGSDAAGIVNHNIDPNIVVVAGGTALTRWLSLVGKDIDNLDGLKGKRIGVTKGINTEVLWNSIKAKYNLRDADYTVINVEGPEMMAAMQRNDLDAFVVWEPWVSRTILNIKGTKIIRDSKGLYESRAFIYMNRKWLDQNRDTAERIMKSVLEANDFIAQNPKQATEMVAKVLKMPIELATELMPKVDFIVGFDDDSLKAFKVIEAQYLKEGKLKAPLNYEKFVEADLLKKARPGSVTFTQFPPK